MSVLPKMTMENSAYQILAKIQISRICIFYPAEY